mmetsp:Transcript_110011/g.200226  ORF Transcript_110011/g.200226 Transcript_110011/m.200226 type:complete len:484 (+) Transcript_110011:63-1514(+)
MASVPEVGTPLHSQDHVTGVREVALAIARQAGPSIMSSVLTLSSELVNVFFIGQFGHRNQLAAVGLGNMMQNVFGLSVGIGLAGAIDTLSSQAHGAGEHRLACIYAQRARVLLSLQLLWIWPILIFSEVWLVALGQDAEVSRLAGEYNRVSAPFLLLMFQNFCLRRLMSAFLRPKGAMLCSAVVSLLHIFWVALFVGHLNLGVAGLGLANGMSWTTRFLLLSFLWYRIAPQLGLERSWVLGFQRESIEGWREFLKLGVPSFVQTGSEWWFWEICSLVVGYLGSTALAAHVASLQFITVPYMIPIGLGQGTCTLVGNAIGAARPLLARRTALVSLCLILCIWTITALAIVALRTPLAMALSHDAAVQDLIKALLLIYSGQGFFDATQCVMGSILRGLGNMKVPSVTYLVSYYLVMLPIGIFFAFPCHMGVSGVWWSMGIGTSFAAVLFAWVIAKTDFQVLTARALARMQSERESAGRDADLVKP